MKAIMYHYIRKYDSNLPFFKFLDFDNFRRQLDFFDKEYGFVSRTEWNVFCNQRKFPDKKGKIILTFDDGIKDHYQYVFRELKSRGLWGIFYITSFPYITKKILNVHRVHLISGVIKSSSLLKFTKSIIKSKMLNKEKISDFQNKIYINQNNDDSVNLKKIINYYLHDQYKTEILNKIESHFNLKFNWEKFYLSKKNIFDMHQKGMIIGAHTVSHKVMSNLDYNDQQNEINDSINFLSDSLSIKCDTYCHPYGGFHSFNDQTIDILNNLNLKFSFNVESREITLSDINANKHSLPRYNCNEFKYGKISQ